MKAFKINRNSWHYKLNKHFFNTYAHTMEFHWEPKHKDFCSYWRATIYRMLTIVALIIGAIAGVIIFGAAVYFHTVQTFSVIASVLVVAAIVAAGVILSEKLENRTKPKTKPESLLAQRYRAHKERICPIIEFTQ